MYKFTLSILILVFASKLFANTEPNILNLKTLNSLKILQKCQKEYENSNSGFIASVFSSERNIVNGIADSFSTCVRELANEQDIAINELEDNIEGIDEYIVPRDILNDSIKSQLKSTLGAILLSHLQYKNELGPFELDSFFSKYPNLKANKTYREIITQEFESFSRPQSINYINRNLASSNEEIKNQFQDFAVRINNLCSHIKAEYLQSDIEKGTILNSDQEESFYASSQEKLNLMYQEFMQTNPHAKLLMTEEIRDNFLNFNSQSAEKCAEGDYQRRIGPIGRAAAKSGNRKVEDHLFTPDLNIENIKSAQKDYKKMLNSDLESVNQRSESLSSNDSDKIQEELKDLLKYRPHLIGDYLQQKDLNNHEGVANYLCSEILKIYSNDELWNIAEIGIGTAALIGAVAVNLIPGVGQAVSGTIISNVLTLGGASVVAFESGAAYRRYAEGKDIENITSTNLAKNEISVEASSTELNRAQTQYQWAIFDGVASLAGGGIISKGRKLVPQRSSYPTNFVAAADNQLPETRALNIAIDETKRVNFFNKDTEDLERVDILKRLGASADDIERLKAANFFDFDSVSMKSMTTSPPLSPANIINDARVSVPSVEGYLVNGKILQVDGDTVRVEYLDKGQTIVKEFQRNQLYQSISSHKLIFYLDKLGVPQVSKGIPKGYMFKDLKIYPREASKTSGKDLSLPISQRAFDNFQERVTALQWLYEQEGPSKVFVKENNDLMNSVQVELKRQGISSGIKTSESGASSIILNGVQENGNRVARLYLRALDRLESQSLTFSLEDNFKLKSGGFNNSDSSRTEMGPVSLVRMLQHQKDGTFLHEARHQMFNNRRRSQSKTSVFDHSAFGSNKLSISGKAPSETNGALYESYMSFEELYTYGSDLRRRGSIFNGKRANFTERELMAISREAARLRDLSSRSKNFTEEMIKEFSKNKKYQVRGGTVIIEDENSRTLSLWMPDKIDPILDKGVLKSKIPAMLEQKHFDYIKNKASNLSGQEQLLVDQVIRRIEVDSSKFNMTDIMFESKQVASAYRWIISSAQEYAKKDQDKRVLEELLRSSNTYTSLENKAKNVQKGLMKVQLKKDGAIEETSTAINDLAMEIRRGLD